MKLNTYIQVCKKKKTAGTCPGGLLYVLINSYKKMVRLIITNRIKSTKITPVLVNTPP